MYATIGISILSNIFSTLIFPVNVFYSNKSPEWPLPSTDNKINTDSSTCDNTTKVASTTLNATSSGSNEWVKPNATKVGTEAAAKGMQYILEILNEYLYNKIQNTKASIS